METCLSTCKNPEDQDQTEEPPRKIIKLEGVSQTDIEQSSEEQKFLELYSLILDEVMKFYVVPEEGIRESIKNTSNAFRTGGSRFEFDKIDFSNWENVCGYLYRYGSHGAGLVRNRILKALKDCRNLIELAVRFGFPGPGPGTDGAGLSSDLLEWCRSNGTCSDLMNTLQVSGASTVTIERVSDLRIIVLGSGPGNDAVGMCSALAEWYRANNWKRPDNMTITLVDKYRKLLQCARIAVESIDSRREYFGNAGELFKKSLVKFNYVPVDLTATQGIDEELDKGMDKYFKALGKAHVIVISKLLSILTLDQCDTIIQSLKENMKKDAFIFLIDQYLDFKWDDFELIYTWGNDPCDAYQSSAPAEPRFDDWDDVSSVLAIRILRLKN